MRGNWCSELRFWVMEELEHSWDCLEGGGEGGSFEL
jgi:hypothetical protein